MFLDLTTRYTKQNTTSAANHYFNPQTKASLQPHLTLVLI